MEGVVQNNGQPLNSLERGACLSLAAIWSILVLHWNGVPQAWLGACELGTAAVAILPQHVCGPNALSG